MCTYTIECVDGATGFDGQAHSEYDYVVGCRCSEGTVCSMMGLNLGHHCLIASHIATDIRHRNNKVASSLLDGCCRMCNSLGMVPLLVYVSRNNSKLKRFCVAQGFRELSLQDAHALKLRLAPDSQFLLMRDLDIAG
jgi:hypothetical protein